MVAVAHKHQTTRLINIPTLQITGAWPTTDGQISHTREGGEGGEGEIKYYWQSHNSSSTSRLAWHTTTSFIWNINININSAGDSAVTSSSVHAQIRLQWAEIKSNVIVLMCIEIEYYQKVSSHAQIWPLGADKQLSKVNVVGGVEGKHQEQLLISWR